MTLRGNLKHEFIAYLRELIDESLFKIDDMVVYLPLSDETFIAQFGTVCTFVNGEFEAMVETNVPKEDVYNIVESSLNMAMDGARFGIENIDALGVACLDVRKIG